MEEEEELLQRGEGRGHQRGQESANVCQEDRGGGAQKLNGSLVKWQTKSNGRRDAFIFDASLPLCVTCALDFPLDSPPFDSCSAKLARKGWPKLARSYSHCYSYAQSHRATERAALFLDPPQLPMTTWQQRGHLLSLRAWNNRSSWLWLWKKKDVKTSKTARKVRPKPNKAQSKKSNSHISCKIKPKCNNDYYW